MASSTELAKQILSRLEMETVEEDNSEGTTCPFDCSSKFSMLHELDEDVYRLESDLTTLRAKIEAHGHTITEFGSHHQALWSDHQRVKGEVERLKETARTHGERLDEVNEKLETLYALSPTIRENEANIATLEEYTDDLDARLDDEKRQRKESDSNLSGWLVIGFLAFLWLLSRQRLAETQAPPLLTPPVRESPADVAARAYVAAKKFR